MSQQLLFSSGLELANLVVNSGLLQLSWGTIFKAFQAEGSSYQQLLWSLSLRYEIAFQSNCTIIAFATTPFCTKQQLLQEGDLVSSAILQQDFSVFDFLCSKGIPCFSIHRAAVRLFKDHFDELRNLKSQIHDSRTGQLSLDGSLIITGHSLGGSVASLFTLWLLDSINQLHKKNQPPAKLPLCITFGSPLLGDQGIQRAISERSKWSSCFLHIAAKKDPFPSLFLPAQNPQTLSSTPLTHLFKPFGTYLLCSESECTCVEDPEGVLKLLESTRNQASHGELSNDYYGLLVQELTSRLLICGNSKPGQSVKCPLQEGLILQLEAIGVERTRQLQQDISIEILIKELEKLERLRMPDQRKSMDPMKKLNQIKKKMAYLEWYKKDCKAQATGYYDSYKNQRSRSDIQVAKHKRALTNYWKKLVEDAERKPQKEGLFIRLAWLYAGTNYRRMVEPLEIADYYRDNTGRDYKTLGRPKHYSLLEQWQDQGAKRPADEPNNKKKLSVAGILTEDSCFWANVEEALFSCTSLKNNETSTTQRESATKSLIDFEQYVMHQINNYAVSPEIFLEQSSFMKWWKAFKEIFGTSSYNSPLINFMKNGGPRQYKKGFF